MKRIRSVAVDVLEESEVKQSTVSHGKFLGIQDAYLSWLQCIISTFMDIEFGLDLGSELF